MATTKKKKPQAGKHPFPHLTKVSIQITKNCRLKNKDDKAGTYDYTVPPNAYIELDAFVYRHGGIRCTGILRVYLPMPNDDFNIFTSENVNVAKLFNKAEECYRLPQGTVLRVVTTGTSNLSVAFTEFRTNQ